MNVASQSGDQFCVQPQPGGVGADVMGHSSHAGADEARVGILHDQGQLTAAHHVDIGRADPQNIAVRTGGVSALNHILHNRCPAVLFVK